MSCCKCIFEPAVDIIGLCDVNKIVIDGTDQTWTELSIPEVLRIPCEKPEVESVDKVFIKLKIISKRVIKTPATSNTTDENQEGTKLTGRKLAVEGVLQQKIVYTALVPEQSVHSAHFEIPFSAFIVIDGDAEEGDGDEYCIEGCIEDVFVKVFNRKEIFKNVTLLLRAKKLPDPPFVCP